MFCDFTRNTFATGSVTVDGTAGSPCGPRSSRHAARSARSERSARPVLSPGAPLPPRARRPGVSPLGQGFRPRFVPANAGCRGQGSGISGVVMHRIGSGSGLSVWRLAARLCAQFGGGSRRRGCGTMKSFRESPSSATARVLARRAALGGRGGRGAPDRRPGGVAARLCGQVRRQLRAIDR